MKAPSHVVTRFKESIFSTMTRLALENKAINLSQGFPDFDGPKWVRDLAAKAIAEGKNQYAPSMGLLSLREAISRNYSRFYGLTYDPLTEVVVTNGATEAIFATCMALLNPGDEVVILEPFYDSYLASIEMAGATAVPVTLKAPNFTFDKSELLAAITEKTKLLIINNPHNPTGKVFSTEEINFIGNLATVHGFYLLSDEVYEFLTYDVAHIPTATYGALKNRTITISSTGKTFGLTGWKVGWAAGPADLIKLIHNVHQFTSFCVAHPLQAAMAEALNNMDEYLKEFKADYTKKKNLLVKGLKEAGFDILEPKGTYFVIAQLSEEKNDIDFCKQLIIEKKVATIPTSAFYLKSKEGEKMIRFCFAKTDETLNSALKNLR
jgi:aspartate/methionine/tyrosine aminotransferase